MIKINNYSLQFDSKELFKKANFIAQNGEVTLITGESGSGKTTFLNSLCFNNHFQADYFYHNINIMLKNKDEKEKYICDKISFVYQFPVFLDDLTIEKHFVLFGNDYLKYDEMNAIERLGINKLRKEFPNQLSDGEKKRVSLCLSFLKNSEVLLADEPTASLDEEYSLLVCELLREYARKGHCVIVASHDLMLNNIADCIYHIQYCELNLLKEERQHIDTVSCKNNIQVSFKHHLSMYICYIKNKTLIFLVTILLIAFVAISCEFNNIAIAVHSENMNNLSSLEVQVYKSIGNAEELQYSNASDEFPITDDELKKLKSIDNIKDIHWRYDCMLSNSLNEKLDLDSDEPEELNNQLAILENGKVIKKGVNIDNVLPNIMIKTYADEMNFESFIEKSFQKEGVYISKDLALEFSKNIEDLKGKSLQMPVEIPVYDASGISATVIENGTEFQTNCIGTKTLLETFPIAGVLKGPSLYETEAYFSWAHQLFIPQSFIEEKAEEYRVDSSIVKYYVFEGDDIKPYYNEYPEGKEVTQTVKATPWQPNNYIITVNHLTNLEQVLADISEIGFDARCTYIDSSSLKATVEGMQNATRIVAGVILIILLAVHYYVKNNNQSIEKESSHFLKSMGLDSRSIKKIKMKKYFIYFIIQSIVCIVIAFAGTRILNRLMFGNTRFSILVCLVVIAICFIVEFIYPSWIERKIMRR